MKFLISFAVIASVQVVAQPFAAATTNWPQFRGWYASGLSEHAVPIMWNGDSGETSDGKWLPRASHTPSDFAKSENRKDLPDSLAQHSAAFYPLLR